MKLLFDGDILTYRLGFASEGASEVHCKARVDEFISDLMMHPELEATDFEGYLTWDSTSNFRVNLAKTKPYKGNRTGKKPKHYDFIREYLVGSWGFHSIVGEEADDAIAKEATELRDTSIIVSIDKDLDQVAGWHYNFVKGQKYYVTDDEGFRNFCIQLLTGDRIDNITGIRGIGNVKAARSLAEAVGYEVQLRTVSELYRKTDNGSLDRFRENCYLLWLRRNKDGTPELIDKLLENYNA